MRCLMLPWLTVVLLRLLTVSICDGVFFYIVGGIPDKAIRESLIMAGLGLIPEIREQLVYKRTLSGRYVDCNCSSFSEGRSCDVSQ